MPDLKPCPFCGATVKISHYPDTDRAWWMVACTGCHATVVGRTAAEVESQWNRRAA